MKQAIVLGAAIAIMVCEAASKAGAEPKPSFTVTRHPLEPRCAYVRDLDILHRTEADVAALRDLFKTTPLLIFPRRAGDEGFLSPAELQDFIKEFDEDHDAEALARPADFPNRMLHPFVQIPGVEHMSPRGFYSAPELYGIKNFSVTPEEVLADVHLWHTDLGGHPFKLPNVVTGFHFIKQPLIGGETDFISGQTIYEALPEPMKRACAQIVLELDRGAFLSGDTIVDYAGAMKVRRPGSKRNDPAIQRVPLLYGPEPAVLPQSGFMESVAGWSRERSDAWLRKFMHDHVLPHRFSVQWRPGDVAVLDNRKFVHAAAPYLRYRKYADSDARLLLQTFLPTHRPLTYLPPRIRRPAGVDERCRVPLARG
eukprot:TRINITY_DN9869_c0_g1_i5.p1 TRINITY_DN9869_c0_g1~~TRINITY_DN9869_c0_g1_i5.p1  ORF type:complete len:368 (-),score=100.61 TRINITY_DN9869_c0_g1_i5:484-1587(-)